MATMRDRAGLWESAGPSSPALFRSRYGHRSRRARSCVLAIRTSAKASRCRSGWQPHLTLEIRPHRQTADRKNDARFLRRRLPALIGSGAERFLRELVGSLELLLAQAKLGSKLRNALVDRSLHVGLRKGGLRLERSHFCTELFLGV